MSCLRAPWQNGPYKTSTRDDTKTLTTSWRNRHLENIYYKVIVLRYYFVNAPLNIHNVRSFNYACSLNATHDGEGGNGCKFDDRFVMAASAGINTDPAITRNTFIFSSCSIDYFTGYINSRNTWVSAATSLCNVFYYQSNLRCIIKACWIGGLTKPLLVPYVMSYQGVLSTNTHFSWAALSPWAIMYQMKSC